MVLQNKLIYSVIFYISSCNILHLHLPKEKTNKPLSHASSSVRWHYSHYIAILCEHFLTSCFMLQGIELRLIKLNFTENSTKIQRLQNGNSSVYFCLVSTTFRCLYYFIQTNSTTCQHNKENTMLPVDLELLQISTSF